MSTQILHLTKSSDVIEMRKGVTYHIYSHQAGLVLGAISQDNSNQIYFLTVGHINPNFLIEILQEYKFPKQIVSVELDSTKDKKCWVRAEDSQDNKAFCVEVTQKLGKYGFESVYDIYEGRIVQSKEKNKWKYLHDDLDREKDN